MERLGHSATYDAGRWLGMLGELLGVVVEAVVIPCDPLTQVALWIKEKNEELGCIGPGIPPMGTWGKW